MSDSDDTDVLLLIPPDLFLVPSSESDDDHRSSKSGAVSELINHVHSLENRIYVIESLNSSFESPKKAFSALTIPNTSKSVSQSPKTGRRSSVPTTPISRTNGMRSDERRLRTNNSWRKHDDITNPASLHANPSRSEPRFVNNTKNHGSRRSLFSPNSSRKSTGSMESRKDEVNLGEVDDLLHDMEATELELAKRIGSVGRNGRSQVQNSPSKFKLEKKSESFFLNGDYRDNNRVWEPISEDKIKSLFDRVDIHKSTSSLNKEAALETREEKKAQFSTNFRFPDASSEKSYNGLGSHLSKTRDGKSSQRFEDSLGFFADCTEKKAEGANAESYISKSQRLLTLSDFWEQDDSKPQEEMLRIKLEEEKFRREHCENVIQELQKKLLEQQEKVAVAIRVDNEKNNVISNFRISWTKLKQRWQNLESEHGNLQASMKTSEEKHQLKIAEFEAQVKKYEGELSKVLDLAAGYKEKSDGLVKEKVDSLQSHADELEKYKTLVQQAENRCEQTREDYNNLMEKSQQLEESVKNAQQELNKERLKGGEIRSEMTVIHKALDTCEAETIVLRQEKESLQLKLKEELSRNNILEQNKIALLAALDDAKKAEKQAKDDAGAFAEQQDKMRSELREVYQKQVDQVVRVKQQEFQMQLDSVETTFQAEFEARQRSIAECAARKIKNVIDKHQLEINLLEEKHKEEKRLGELKLAQMVQKLAMLEAELNSQQASKNKLVEQLHSVMQRQWQQALHIISGENGKNLTSFQRVNMDKFFEIKNPTNHSSALNDCAYNCTTPVRLENYPGSSGHSLGARPREQHSESLVTLTSNDEAALPSKKDSNNDLRGYIKMILDMQQSKDDLKKSRFAESNGTPPPVYHEVPKKHYMKKELSIMSEDSVTWHPLSESSVHDNSEYIPVPQKLNSKDPQKWKPPWK